MKRMSYIGITMSALLGACMGAAEPGETTPSNGPVSDQGSFSNERIHEEAQVRIWVPDRWKVHGGRGNMLIMNDPREEVSIMFAIVEGEDLLSALLAVTEGVLDEVDDVQLVGSPESANLNGMDALLQDGKGVVDGVEVDLSVGIVLTPANKYLLIVGLAESEALHRHEHTLTKILTGLKPYRG